MCVLMALPAAPGKCLYMTLPRGPLALSLHYHTEGAMNE